VAWVCGRTLVGTAISNTFRCVDICLVSVLCCQVQVSASDWSLVQRSPTERGVSERDREASIIMRPWPTKDCCAMERYTYMCTGWSKVSVHLMIKYKNTKKYFKQFQWLTMITYLELGIKDGVSVSLVSPWLWRSAAKQSDWAKYWGKKDLCCDNDEQRLFDHPVCMYTKRQNSIPRLKPKTSYEHALTTALLARCVNGRIAVNTAGCPIGNATNPAEYEVWSCWSFYTRISWGFWFSLLRLVERKSGVVSLAVARFQPSGANLWSQLQDARAAATEIWHVTGALRRTKISYGH
jgi:hypothetical protein